MTEQINYPIGVLIMAYGGPNSLEELPGYLADIRNGRPTYPAVLEEISNNYAQIGGRSPIMEYTSNQINAVADLMDSDKYKFYLGMRHWGPWIEEVVGQMIDDGITHAIGLVLAPHYSKLSIAKYIAKIEAGMEMYRGQINFEYIKSYHDEPELIEAFANRVKQGIEAFPAEEQDDVHVILSAHSLPVRIIKAGDPYQDQLFETADLIAQKAGLREDQWSWSYQSEGRSPEPWLGPQLEAYIPQLHEERGVDKIVSIAIGFVSDHVEILFDIDIEAKAVADELGIQLERPPALNNDPLYINLLARLIRERAEKMGWV